MTTYSFRPFHAFYLACLVAAFVFPFCQAVPAAARTEYANVPPSIHQELPGSVFDGDPFLVSFTAPGLESVRIKFRGKDFKARAVSKEGQDAQTDALLSIPLEHKESLEQVIWTAQGNGPNGAWSVSGTNSVLVVRKEYPVQKLTLDPKYVTPPPEMKERIERERKLINQALATLSQERYWVLPLSRPVPGSLSSTFGMRRTLNGATKSTHRGLDFRAKAGDPVAACADGRVVLTGEFYYAGNCVIVDHGLGVLTTYMHLSTIDARQGQMLRRGDILGKVGSTGRSTGPHLHLSLTVLGTGVTPQTVLEQLPQTLSAPASPSTKRQP